jgi:hypothetical protein
MMTRAIIFDFSRVLLFPLDPDYTGSLNDLNKDLIQGYQNQGGNYPFFDYFLINTELIEFIGSLSGETDVYIFTTDSIQDRPEVKNLLTLNGKIKGIFRAKELGVLKDTPEAFKLIAEKIGAKPEELMYVDDSIDNVNAADKAGVRAFLYLNNSDVIRNISKLF